MTLSFNQFPCMTYTVAHTHLPVGSKTSFFRLNPIGTGKFTEKSRRALIGESKKLGPLYVVQAYQDDDEWGREKEERVVYESGSVAVAEEKVVEKPSSKRDRLKKALLDSCNGTDRGLKTTSETRGKIAVLISQLEVNNPTPAPSEAVDLLNGKWILAYTSFSGLLSRGLPWVKVKEISQTVNPEKFTTINSVQFSGLLAPTSFNANVKFEILGPQLSQIKLEEVKAPQLTDSMVLPENMEFFGRSIDLTPLKGLITAVKDKASSVSKTISSQLPLKVSFNSNSSAESWSLTTYLDEDTRIGRGDGGSVFVLIKEGSPLLELCKD